MSVRSVANDRLTANRRLFLGVYLALGLLSALAYLSRVNLPFARISSRWIGLGEIAIALPGILPYLFSGIYAWQLISERRLGLYLFLAATAVGTVMASLLITGVFDVGMGVVETIFWYVVGQTAVYCLAAGFLLRIEWP